MAITDTRIRAAKPAAKPYKIHDSEGLYLLIQANGSRLWRFKYRLDLRPGGGKKEHLHAIGAYPEISLAEAREERDKARKLVARGVHPTRHRKAEKARGRVEAANTFEVVAREWMGRQQGKWSSYYASQVERTMTRDVFPELGALPIREITAAQLLGIVKAVEERGAETVALLIRQWCSAIFRYAVATLRADADPAAILKGAIHRPKVKHNPPLDEQGIKRLLGQLETFGGYRATAIAMRLLLILFVRPVELRGAEWKEFDLDRAEWRIPAERMKMREAHTVPLSRQAVALLHELQEITGSGRHLFPNHRRPKTVMTTTTLNRALERMGFGGQFSSHGFRATASTALNELGFHGDVIESQLAHEPRDKVRASYNRAKYFAERREMMQAWADHIGALGGGVNVTAISRRKRA